MMLIKSNTVFCQIALVVFCCVVCLASSPQSSGESLPTPAEVLGKYSISLANIREASNEYTIIRENDDSGPTFRVRTGEGNFWGQYQENSVPSMKTELSATNKNTFRGWVNFGVLEQYEGNYVLESRLSPVEMPAKYFFSNFGCGYFWGYIYDENGVTVDILELLSKCELKVETDQIDEKNVLLLNGTWGNGNQIRVWFDHFPECNVVSIETTFPRSQPGNVFYSRYAVNDFTSRNNVIFPFRYTEDIRIAGGEANSIQYDPVNVRLTYQMKNIDTGKSFSESDFELTFASDIPDGTPVNMQDAPHIEHIWYDGRVVPKTDEVMLAIARGGHKFMPGPDEPRFWLWMFSFLLIALGLGKMIYNIIYKKEAGT